MGRAQGTRRGATDETAFAAALAQARAGDEAAFARVYRTVNPRLVGYLRGLVGNDADDVASETWHDVVRALGDFRGDGPAFRAWTATIARNRALDHLRRSNVRPRTTELVDTAKDSPADQDSERLALESLSTAHALSLIAELPRDQAEAVLLRVVLGLDAPMAAQVLGKQPGAVRTAAHRGLKRLAERMRRPGGTEEK
ncbi:RNA polymerase sigma factor [Actinacidiphila rubida]|uniref:RNA polymerase sigma-70 factor, ECF subfamily n=1 Tax=Actinacidiphila rubida TaxID=310780 RepID=A0A1H8P0J8_9ACTN|nr:RNA polymerase sigma factor [Actinacidiphila rubida]SEO35377.1 RNA polymerase sigma-70 factor, ECF subfamily [Actinacidiphila rubida]